MGYTALLIPYGLEVADTVGDDYYIRVEQEKEAAEATLGEVAELIDDLFAVSPCVEDEDQPQPEEGETQLQPPPKETFEDFIKKHFAMDLCAMDGECNWLAKLKVIRSHPAEPYTLRLTSGTVQRTTVVEDDIDDLIVVEGQSGVLLDWPVHSGGEFAWNGSVLRGEESGPGPEISRDGNALNWDGSVTGAIRVRYQTIYDLVEIMVPGVVDPETLEPAPGECRAICFFHGLVDELDLEEPRVEGDDVDRNDYCGGGTGIDWPDRKPQWVTWQVGWKCQCSGKIDHYTYDNEADKWDREISDLLDAADALVSKAAKMPGGAERDAVLAQADAKRAEAEKVAADHNKALRQYIFPGIVKYKFGDYIDCGESTGDIADPVFYEQVCCGPPEMALPKCASRREKNGGGVKLDPDTEQWYRDKYGEALDIVYVLPANGDCGTVTYEQAILPHSCCDEVAEDLHWEENLCVDFIPDNASGVLTVSGGLPVRTWRVLSPGAWLDAARTKKQITTSANAVTVYTDSSACGMIAVAVTDNCVFISREIRAEDGKWVDVTSRFPDGCALSGPSSFTGLPAPFATGYYTAGRYRQTEKINVYYFRRHIGTCYAGANQLCLGDLTGQDCLDAVMAFYYGGYGGAQEQDTPLMEETCLDWSAADHSGGLVGHVSPKFGGQVDLDIVKSWQQAWSSPEQWSPIWCGGTYTASAEADTADFRTHSLKVEEWQC